MDVRNPAKIPQNAAIAAASPANPACFCGKRPLSVRPNRLSGKARMPDVDSVAARYAARVAAGDIERDRAQERALGRLARLETELAGYRRAGLVGSLTRRLTGR